MKKYETINVLQFDGMDTASHKTPIEAIKFELPQLPNESFYYIKGKAHNKTSYILIEGKTGMEFCRGANMEELRENTEKRVKTYGAAKIEQLIKDMAEKYKSLPVVEPETITH